MRTLRVTTGTLVIAGLLGGAAGGGFVGTAGADDQAGLVRCEADFLAFMVGSDNDAIHSGCQDLTPAYQAGVAAYRQRNATCDAISGVAHPIKRAQCETGARWDGLKAFRTSAKAIRDAPASATTATTVASTGSVLGDGVNAVSRLVEEHPAATVGLGLGAAALAFPPTRAATLAVGSGVTGVLGKLVNVVKAPFVAAARAIA